VSVNEATKSIKIDRETGSARVTLMTYDMNDEVEIEQSANDCQRLKDAGFTSVEFKIIPKIMLGKLVVAKGELLNFFETDRLQFRKPTGNQFTARVQDEQGEIYRLSLGLIVLDRFVKVMDSLPRKQRKDKLRPEDSVNHKLPIGVPYLIYVKD
jgi:hypothetical protein